MRGFVVLLFLLSVAVLPGHAETLFTGIEHKEQLPEVPANLRAGSVFDERYLPPLHTDTRWTPIPSWMAGTWLRKTSKAKMFGVIPVSRLSIRQRRYGHQTDATGQVWHYLRTPLRSVTECSSYVSFFLSWSETLSMRGDEMDVRTIWTCWDVSRRGGRILGVRQGDQIDRIRQESDGVLKVSCSMASYDERGRYLETGRSTWKDELYEAYEPIDMLDGVPLKLHFARFLVENGMKIRIPGAPQMETWEGMWSEASGGRHSRED